MKTHCRNGHERTEADFYITSKGIKRCRACDREQRRRNYERLLKGGTGHRVDSARERAKQGAA